MRMPQKSRNVSSLLPYYYPIGQDFTETKYQKPNYQCGMWEPLLCSLQFCCFA